MSPLDARVAAQVIFKAALSAADPYRAVIAHKKTITDTITQHDLKRVVSVGFGKAAAAMAAAAEDIAAGALVGGVIVTKHGHAGERHLKKFKVLEAAHPVPDENSLRAAHEVLAVAQEAGEDTLLLCLISGGGSALLAAPAEGVSHSDKQAVTDALLRAGADIGELNAVRKHISAVKGGRLALAAWPARTLSLIVSDVMGDPLDVIASGPTAPDRTTFAEALGVLKKYGIEAPEGVKDYLKHGAMGLVPEGPKPGQRVMERVQNIIVANNGIALEAAARQARSMGLHTEVLTDSLGGEAREAAGWLMQQALSRWQRPFCLIAGGETTVTVTGSGKGGRNTELALAFALEAEDAKGITLLAAGTDGTDGPTDAAGAIVDQDTAPMARAKDLSADDYLRENDSYGFFNQTGELLKTGPTGTNVMDINIIIAL